MGSWGCPVPGRAHDPAASVVEGVVMCVRESTLAAALVDGCVLGCVEVHVQSLWLELGTAVMTLPPWASWLLLPAWCAVGEAVGNEFPVGGDVVAAVGLCLE